MNQPSSVQYLPVERLRTSYHCLRPGKIGYDEDSDLQPLPLRVAANDDGSFEIIDGFKRFSIWMKERRETVPVVIESPGSRAEHKRRLLQANAPHRTLTPLDEGRVVDSLLTEDGMTATAIAKLLGRKKSWVVQRAVLPRKLSEEAQEKLAAGHIRPTVAFHLTSFPFKDQNDLLACFSQHSLRCQEQLIVLQGYRVGDVTDRRSLLKHPLGFISPNPSPVLSPRLQEIENALESLSRGLAELGAFRIPADLAPAEHRRLEACLRRILHEAKQHLSAFEASISSFPKENLHEKDPNPSSRPRSGNSGADPGPVSSSQYPQNLQSVGNLPEADSEPSRERESPHPPVTVSKSQARPLQEVVAGEGGKRLDRHQNSLGTEGIGLSGRPDDSGTGSESTADAVSPQPQQTREATLRNPGRKGNPGRLVTGNREDRGETGQYSRVGNGSRPLPETLLRGVSARAPADPD